MELAEPAGDFAEGRVSVLARGAASLGGLAMLALILVLYYGGWPQGYQALMALQGFPPVPYPFLDTEASLSAWECTRLGFDVIALNPCDTLGRPYNYAPFWMSVAFIPLGSADRVWVGLVLDLVFVLSLLTLPVPGRWGDAAVMALAGMSTAVVFALERANTDLLLFMGMLAVVALVRRGPVARWLGYAVVWLMAAIKYYPAVLMIFAVRESRAMFAAVCAVSVALGAIFIAMYHADAARAMALVPSGPPDVLLFAAKNLPIFLGQLAGGTLAVTVIVQALLVMLCLRLAMAWRRDRDLMAALNRLPEQTQLLLVAGSIVLIGCFFATQNIVYRSIYFLPVLPGLLAMGDGANKLEIASACRGNAVVILFLMSADLVRNVLLAFLPDPLDGVAHVFLVIVRELAWWWIVALVGAFVMEFLGRSPVAALVVGKLGRTRSHD